MLLFSSSSLSLPPLTSNFPLSLPQFLSIACPITSSNKPPFIVLHSTLIWLHHPSAGDTGIPSCQVPKDDLDFRIKTLYDHHSGFLQDKSQVLLHSETVNDDHGRLKMPIPEELPPPVLPYKTIQGTLRHWVNPKKESIYSVQGTIVSPHNAATNGGFSRKMDGGFFST
uniref:Uncharacterized protein n=1 Tax=Ornithorhynchus anatinus TaxID=9258 RepID=A0A6I8PHJ9_ORNAN